jgi:hypothetical protein
MRDSKPPTGDYVLTNFRYLSAYNELVARISQRLQTLTLFIGIFTGLITALIAARDMFKTAHSSIVWIMAGFPVAGLVLTLLNYKYETIITLLRRYLAELERVGGAQNYYPSYNCSVEYVAKANSARYYHDLVCGVLVLVYNVAAVGIYCSISNLWSAADVVVIIGVGLVGLACVAAHLRLYRRHYTPISQKWKPRHFKIPLRSRQMVALSSKPLDLPA